MNDQQIESVVEVKDGDEVGLGGFCKDGKRQELAAYLLVRKICVHCTNFVPGRGAGPRKAHRYLVLRLPQTLRRMQQPGIVGVSEAVSGVTGAGHADDP